MALITCPDCKKQVSDQAQACPDCGCPIKKPTVQKSSLKPVHTIEATSKKYKALQLVGVILMSISVVFCVAAGVDSESPGNKAAGLGGSFFLIGIIVYITARALTWWHHR